MMYMVELGLFENTDGTVTCLKLAKRLDDTNAKNPQIKQIVQKIYQNEGKCPEILGVTPTNSDKLGDAPTNSGQIRLDKNRLDKSKSFTPPTQKQVEEYISEMGYSFSADRFVDFYSASNWHRGKTKIKDWKACARTWEKNTKQENSTLSTGDYL